MANQLALHVELWRLDDEDNFGTAIRIQYSGDLGSRLIFGRPPASKRHDGNLQGTVNQGELNGRRSWECSRLLSSDSDREKWK